METRKNDIRNLIISILLVILIILILFLIFGNLLPSKKGNSNNNVTIDFKLIGDSDRKHYPILPGVTFTSDEKDEYNLGSWEGNPLDCFASLITGINVSNVAIVGQGTIDGNVS